jgi:hypothetical protein
MKVFGSGVPFVSQATRTRIVIMMLPFEAIALQRPYRAPSRQSDALCGSIGRANSGGTKRPTVSLRWRRLAHTRHLVTSASGRSIA